MGTPTAAPLSTHLYLTNGRNLLYVLDLPDEGQAIVEDAADGKVYCIASKHLDGWRIVEPAHAA